MKGRGEIITILCMSVFLICILYAMTYGGVVKAEELEKQPEEAGEKTEVDIEAVSYTHLDVYKRQQLKRIHRLCQQAEQVEWE